MTERPDTTRVNINGREYSIRGEGDPAYIAEIAHFLDMRMRQMTGNVSMTSTAKVAILASLNITDELFTKTRQLEEMEDNHHIFLSQLADKIDSVLDGTDTPPDHPRSIFSDNNHSTEINAATIFHDSNSSKIKEPT